MVECVWDIGKYILQLRLFNSLFLQEVRTQYAPTSSSKINKSLVLFVQKTARYINYIYDVKNEKPIKS